MKGRIRMVNPIDPTRPCLRTSGVAARNPISAETIWAWQFFLSLTTFIALTVLDLRMIIAGGLSVPVHVLNWVGLLINWIGIMTAIYFRTLVKWQKLMDGGI